MFTQENRVSGILNVYTRKETAWYTECLYKKTEFMVYWMFIQENRGYGILNVYIWKQSNWYTECLYKKTE